MTFLPILLILAAAGLGTLIFRDIEAWFRGDQ